MCCGDDNYVLTSVHSISENSIEAKGRVSIAEAVDKTPNLQQFKLGYVITYMYAYVAATMIRSIKLIRHVIVISVSWNML